MSEAPAGLVQRALGGHAAIGLLAGALMYIICLTGTLAVIHDRFARWEQPGAPEMATLAPDAAQAAMQAAIAAEAGKPRTTHLYVRMPNSDLPRAAVTTDSGGWTVDRAGRLAGREGDAWTSFLVDLHETLHLPATWGLILVGALGVVLAALAVTGVVAHPRIIRDAFRLRTRHGAQIARADWHNRLGVWTLPFAIAIALTGAFIGLGGVGVSVLAKAYAGGQTEKIYAPLFGGEGAPDLKPAPLPDIAAALRTLAARAPGTRPTYVIVHDPGTRGQHVQIIAAHPRRLIYGETYGFDARGRWLGGVGLADGTIGQQAASSTYNLHFGNYGGLPVEIAYLLFGLALCVVTATGTTLWLEKRRRRGLPVDRLAACWQMVVWGTPLALTWLIWLRAAAGIEAPLGLVFWAMLAVGVALATARPGCFAGQRLRGVALLSVIATGLVHLLGLRPAALATVALDAVAIVAAAVPVWLEWRGRRRVRPGH
jgi:uncharacterized iron-regulated membrane protein